MRITGGDLRGRRLFVPKEGVRPTADRVREAIFSSVAARVPGARVLDLYAGSGALGIEAWSRGADAVLWVERDRRAFDTLRRNVAALCGEDAVRACLREDAGRFLRRPGAGRGPFDLVLADPPYDLADLGNHLPALRAASMLAEHGVVVYEQGDPPPEALAGWRVLKRKQYGRTWVVILTPSQTPEDPVPARKELDPE